MSGKGDCWDNAVAESFWATLKNELANHERYATREEARQPIFEYIEMFYNRNRLHSSLSYQSPEAFDCFQSSDNGTLSEDRGSFTGILVLRQQHPCQF